jgi:hypothetical protein
VTVLGGDAGNELVKFDAAARWFITRPPSDAVTVTASPSFNSASCVKAFGIRRARLFPHFASRVLAMLASERCVYSGDVVSGSGAAPAGSAMAATALAVGPVALAPRLSRPLAMAASGEGAVLMTPGTAAADRTSSLRSRTPRFRWAPTAATAT